MNDQDFLSWIYQRLAIVHGEPENTDYMNRLRCVVVDTSPDIRTPNDGRGGSGYVEMVRKIMGKEPPR